MYMIDLHRNNMFNKTNANHFRQKLRRYLKQQSIPHETINDDKSIEQKHAIVDLSREEEILAKLDEINSMRGKRGINYQNQFESLNALRQQVDQENLDVKIIIKILFTQITINLDQENEYVKHSTLDYIEELIALLPGNTESDDDLIALIVQMNEKYKRSLQHTDLYSQDYIERLKDECRIYTILDRLKTYFKSTNHLCTIYLLMIEYIYYKISDQSSITLIDCYCKYIYINDILNHARTRASLCQIYHLALHDYYYQARDLMLMCHLQDTIHSSDILTQILYNRTMIQLGLCAFRCGKIFEAHQALVDFQSGNRIKELLGQDIHLPYHMHINLQLIECIYFISAMLIEIPSIRKHVISKRFYNLMSRAEKQTILGPPESMQEHIIAASQAMKTADWKICVNYLINEKMKNIIWEFIPKSSQVIEMLINKIKEESLRIYLITSAICFSNISIPALTDMFQLPIKNVYSIISKMIINQELIATIEPSDEIVSIHAHHPSEIENLSVDLMEKTCRLNEQNHFLSKIIQ